jgi:predicted O-linked N-acetylglucosamine transferase (SPINDLY family)
MSLAAQQKLATALYLFQRGEIEDADSVARDVLRRTPKSAEALHLRGVIAGLRHRHADAESFLLTAASLDKKNHFICFNLAKALSEQGRDSEALRWHRKALELNSENDRAWLNYGLSLSRLGDLQGSISAIDRALAINECLVEGYLIKGGCLRETGAFDDALALYNRAVELIPSLAEAWSNLGDTLKQLKRYEEALASYERLIELDPESAEAWSKRGIVLRSLTRYADALTSYERSLSLKPDYAEAWSNRGNVLHDLMQLEEALASYERSIEIAPNSSEAWNNRGITLNDLKRHKEAIASYEKSLELKPESAEAWSNRGNALNDLKRYQEALSSYEKSLEVRPNFAEAWSNRGNVQNELRRHEEALSSCERSLALKPDYAEAWNNRGIALGELKRNDEALSSYERSLKLKPDYAEALSNRGSILNELKRPEEALASYEQSIKLKPDADYILGELVHTQMKICVWTNFVDRCETLQRRLFAGDNASTPFPVLGLFDDPCLQKYCAELFVKNKFGQISPLGLTGKKAKRDKIRVGYFSMDFCEHPVADLIVEMIELHDRNRFEIYGFSFGVNTGDHMRKRLEVAFDNFLEVRQLSELDIARLARELEIDIAVDLGGHTKDARPAIFAYRAAPIQINYLGFPGTMGMEEIDYFIGDRITVTDDTLNQFSEKIIFMPDSFQANPTQKPIHQKESTREAHRLPEGEFVFCCFNNIWKITPDVFQIWTRILQQVKGSVLWLQSTDQKPIQRLSAEFQSAGISASRIVCASRLRSFADHLGRYQIADLFLDTFPYGAHTTASDALWTGLPILTRSGRSFASRVASSLLHALSVPELITKTPEEYQSLAIELANNPGRLKLLRAKLAKSKLTSPLFNTALFTENIESGYQAAYDRYHNRLAPDHIYVGL